MSRSARNQNPMRILICGPRDFPNYLYVLGVVAGLKRKYGPNIIIVEGEANGVDKFARRAAEALGLAVDPYPADWSKGAYAGPKRNREMLILGTPKLVVGIGYGKGTADMMSIARAAGVRCEWHAIWWVGASAR